MDSRSYVITGASTGIGRASVTQIVRTGAHVWASVRTDEDEKALRYLVGTDAHAAAMVARLPYRLRYRLTAARS